MPAPDRGESPVPPHRDPPKKRSSLSTFFAFSSKRRPSLAAPATWRDVHVISPSAVPSPLRTDDDEFYYSYYSLSPLPSSPAPGKLPDSQPSSPSHIHFQHPIPLRHASSQPLQGHVDLPPPHQTVPDPLEHPLKASASTPNLATPSVRPRTLSKKRKERWLSAQSWWDAILSPSPRFKIKQASRQDPATEPASIPAQAFPSVRTPRPRAVSVTSPTPNAKPLLYSASRSRSAADILGHPSARPGFEPALETLVDEPTPTPDRGSPLPLPDPPVSLEQVIDESEAFDQQRAEWKRQATRSIGNKHTRSFSRARSKSLSERHARGHHASESGRPQFNLELLAARTLLGSQSTMPTVHVTKPSNSSLHSKAYSHSHSQSAYSFTHTSHSHGHSHSHSHSLTTSNSSKSSRNIPPRGHSRAGSWSKTAFLKAGSLCGVVQDESDSSSVDEKAPSSRVDGPSASKPHSPPCEVGIAITSSSSPDGYMAVTGPRHQEKDRASRHTQSSSEYAGPHPSVIDSVLPQLAAASDVSLRHRLPPRPAIHPPIAPIPHPYRSASSRPELASDKASEATTLQVLASQEATANHPHISLSQTDFEQYGVGEALVYASRVRTERHSGIMEANEPLPPAELSPSDAKPPLEIVVPSREEPDTGVVEPEASSSVINNPPSLTSSTIQMVMSAFDNPDDLDEFQDLFYRPQPSSRDQEGNIDQMPTDDNSSVPNSPLTHLVRKLSEEVHGRRDPSRTPSGSIHIRRSESRGHASTESGTKNVFTDVSRSTSPPPMESPSQPDIPVQMGSEATAEDVRSAFTTSVLESPWPEQENDTFGYRIRHGQFEAATSPSPVQSPRRLSTHLSIQEDLVEEDDPAFLSPTRRRFTLSEVDAVRSSYLTTSDVSRMSGLSDFPMPPSGRPFERVSHLETYYEPSTPSSESHTHREDEDETETETETEMEGEEDADPSGDVGETLRVLRMEQRITSYDSRRTTFGGSEDMDFITQVHQARP